MQQSGLSCIVQSQKEDFGVLSADSYSEEKGVRGWEALITLTCPDLRKQIPKVVNYGRHFGAGARAGVYGDFY